MADIFDRAQKMGVEPLVRQLLGCAWGREIHTPDDADPCPEQAVQITVLHNGPATREVRLCQRHTDRVLAETTPHQEAKSDG